jgi:hypothetical protein
MIVGIRESFCLLGLLVLATPVFADVVELTSGQTFFGTFKQAGGGVVIIEAGGRTLTFEQSQVRAIYFSPPPAPETSQAPTLPPVASADALAVLKQLQKLASQGVERSVYTREVADSKPLVERYLKGAGNKEGATSGAIEEAFGLYELAAAAWDSRATNTAAASAAVGRNPYVDRCPAMKAQLDSYPPPDTQENAWRRGAVVEFELAKIWACASGKVAEVERALAR